MKSNKISKKALPIGLGVTAGALIATGVAIHLATPRPVALAAREIAKQLKVEKPDDYARYSLKVQVRSDVTYGSLFENDKLDVHMPIGEAGSTYPVVFWLHGGGFVGGTRRDCSTFCTMLASRGFVVVNLDYALAPDFTYPTPVLQLGEAYRFVAANAAEFRADMSSVAFGGDSAGGQIAGQFVNIQVNADFARACSIAQLVDAETIKAAVFFCTPFDMRHFDYISSGDGVPATEPVPMVGRLPWSYFCDRNWRESDEARRASLVENVDTGFPATYITDSAVFSFAPQASEMAAKLKLIGTDVQTYLPSVELGPVKESIEKRRKLPHGYQYNMELPQAFRNFELCTSFLREHM